VTNKQPNKQTEVTHIRGKKQRNSEKKTKRITEEERKRKPKEKEDECEQTRQRRTRQRLSANSWYILFVGRARCNKE